MGWDDYDEDTRDEPHSMGCVDVKRTTEKALLVEDQDGEEYWIPKSQIHQDSDLTSSARRGDFEELLITQWLAEQKGLV